jgi:oligoribonuclease NrnB/cAMP/cGMP phosphodiesterase (DHH superfamily)
MKILKEVAHFTHTDADGLGCGAVGKHIFSFTKLFFCDYHNVDTIVKDFIFQYIDDDGKQKDICPYELVLITDISVKEDTAILLEHFSSVTGTQLILIDHHDTSLWLNEYDWAEVMPEIDGRKSSGTSEMFRLIVAGNPIFTIDEAIGMESFCEQIRLYDTWDWTRVGATLPRYINELLYIIGREAWLERFINNIDPQLTEAEQYLVDTELERIDRFVTAKEKQMFKTDLHGYRVGIVYAEQNHSILGNTICQNNPDIDFVIIINMGAAKISFRSIKPEIHTGEFAKKFYNGGGHAPASGCEFSKHDREAVFEYIMNYDEFRDRI